MTMGPFYLHKKMKGKYCGLSTILHMYLSYRVEPRTQRTWSGAQVQLPVYLVYSELFFRRTLTTRSIINNNYKENLIKEKQVNSILALFQALGQWGRSKTRCGTGRGRPLTERLEQAIIFMDCLIIGN